MTMSGWRSLISPIARSIRLGMKCGPPQWMSEMCAIVNVRSAAGIGRSVVPTLGLSEAVATIFDVASETPDFQAYCGTGKPRFANDRSEEHTSELQSLRHLVCRLLLE